jgi:hypothetical protein
LSGAALFSEYEAAYEMEYEAKVTAMITEIIVTGNSHEIDFFTIPPC